MKHKRPSARLRADQRNRARAINEGFSAVNLKDIEINGNITFRSLTFGRVHENTRATTFIVRTKRPIPWGLFVEKVTEALEEVV